MTRAEIKTALQALGYGTDTDTVQNTLIDQAYREVAGSRTWSWLEGIQTNATLAVGDNTVNALATDIDTVNDVFIELGSTYLAPLTEMDAEELLRRAHEDRTNDIPLYYAQYEGSLFVHPRPDQVYTITIHYHKVPTMPTGDSWVPPFPDTFHEVLVYGALKQMAFRQRDWSAFNVADATFRMILRQMGAADQRGEQSNTVEKWDGWSLVK